ncbi:glycoside-pentoside-hexuronide (GPH):cation symporter [Paenibacillus sp. HN-1]|uniref:glycoside-pentoside-hexuronide (GPH):cation symporter n=1 Tax=Paenibacillus TaxID=44249 RepID=UPI001CA7CA33|nr:MULTISPECIES: glycoside-pentoside-hexuronide (GPH):cation symporter [Paenibacillus]MBY9080263.1 glycoside-pentoside-hexuronide (GPH):cation symporter [Paenibacillus sp. CGMCC 1.18879]MBY9083078.1 glycoside-pentoside-hexuronide (GPH):cation symporter [Paenibacillus sinensis]
MAIREESNQKLSLLEKVSYGLGDTASNLIYAVVTTYLTYYFTDIYGIGAAAVGTLLLVARLVDMVDSPILGILIDKTHTRWGKSRPWILWSCLPFAIVTTLLFMGPELSASGKLAYAYIFYIASNILYTAVNNPLTTLLPSLSSDIQERTVANSFRMFGGQFGGLIVNLTLLPLVAFFGNGDQQKGFFHTMILFGIVGLVMFLITFLNTRERVQDKSGGKSLPVKESIKAIKGNLPWYAGVLVGVVFFILYVIKLSSGIYYITYNLNQPDMVATVNTLGSLTLVGIIFVPLLSKKSSKKTLMIIGMAICMLGQFIIYLGQQSTFMLLTGTVVGAIGLGLPVGLLFALIADTVDYGEWKSGVRAQGLLASTASGIAIKLGSGLGGAIPAWLLAAGGYVANQTQTSSALRMIEISFIWLPIVLCLLSILILAFMYKWEKPHHEIIAELELRRAQ